MAIELFRTLEAQKIQFVRLLWCDNASVIRAKAFHTSMLGEHQQTGIGIAMAQQAIPVMVDAVATGSGLTPVGEVWLSPDWSTLAALPYAPGHARVMSNLLAAGEPWALCPRHCLRRAIAQADALGYKIKAAFEPEFYLLQMTPTGFASADQTAFAATWGMDLNCAVINDIAAALIAQGIPVERYYPESGAGQHELSVRYTDALQAADWQIAYRETVRGVALRHGLRASFLPKIFADQAGSGCHLHLSLWQNGQNLMPDGGSLSAIARSFVAGVLSHLPALMAITTPSVNSYRRLQPHCWSGAFRCWGSDNREAAVRVPSSPTAPSPAQIELKTVDATANPYLALAGAIAAGLDGIRRGLALSDPVTVDPGTLSDAARAAQGIDRLPTSLGEAIAQLRQDAVLLDALGPELAQAFLAVRQAEWDALQGMALEDEVARLLERY